MMKRLSCICMLLMIFPFYIISQSHTLTVENGYGTGVYEAGDTVHIFAKEFGAHQYFDKWSGDHQWITERLNWHSTIVMPDHDVVVTAQIDSSNIVFTIDSIMGQERIKPLYYAIPPGYHSILHLFHGTGGNANFINSVFEVRNTVNKALNAGFAVIVTEAEESTTGIDVNGDGKLRWQLVPYNTATNVDFANIIIISAYLAENAGLDLSKPTFAMGYSNGGFFAQSLGFALNFDGAVSVIGQGMEELYDDIGVVETEVPTLWLMGENDTNSGVNQEGLQAAMAFRESLADEGICADLKAHKRYRVYPERFARARFSVSESTNIFDELLANQHLDASHLPRYSADSLKFAVVTMPQNYPILSTISEVQRNLVFRQWDICYAEHIIFDDHDGTAMRFMEELCMTTGTMNSDAKTSGLHIYPNPFSTSTRVEFQTDRGTQYELAIFNMQGHIVRSIPGITSGSVDIDRRQMPAGIYVVQLRSANDAVIGKLSVR